MAEPTADANAHNAEALPPPSLRRDGPAVVAMGVLFIASIGLAMAFSSIFDEPVFEDKESLYNPLFYLGLVVAFTVIILLIAKYANRVIIKYIILASVLLTIYYVLDPLLGLFLPRGVVSGSIAFLIGTALTVLLWFYPEWYVIDTVGVLVAAGATGIFGISFGLLPSLILLVGFAVYDAIAVYRTRHMLALADSVLELRLPIMFVVPKTRGYSFLEETRRVNVDEEEAEKAPREAMFMGLGDAVIPGILVVASLVSLDPAVTVAGMAGNMFVALVTLVGSLFGFAALMYFVLKGNPHAGLPLLNGGAIAAFFLAMLPLYGVAPLVPSF